METPSRGFRRLVPGGEVRLRHAYIIACDEVIKDEDGEIVELRCTADLDTRSGSGAQRRVNGTIQWVSAQHAITGEVRLYERLYTKANPQDVEEGETFKDYINPNSVEIVAEALLEPSLAGAEPGDRFQFERHGYFIVDTVDSRPDALVFNRIVALRDSWKPPGTEEESAEAMAAPEPVVDEPVVVGSVSDERERIRAADPALAAAYVRFQEELGLSEGDADMLTSDTATTDYFEAALAQHDSPKTVANWVINEVIPLAGDESLASLEFSAGQLGELVALVDEGVITRRIGIDVLAEMAASGVSPATVVEEKGLLQISDADALAPIVDQVMADNADKVEEYRAGKTGLLGFFTGQVMRATGGKADAKLVQALLVEKLG